ncbi:MAG: glycosyltransferase [Dehalococcoidia bacterium]|nr:MAG: glycosyltransferase [Dehalococcoidia bacterium]
MGYLPLSAIIVVKNAEKTLDDCLKSVRRNNPAEIIIIDGMSTDRTLEISRAYTERIYCDEGKGVSVAHQIGAEQAAQEYLAYIDSDIILTDGALAAMLEEFKAGGYANLQATVLPRDDSTYWARAIEQHVQLIRKRNPGGLSTALLRKDVTLKIGFDPSIKVAGDDVDFLTRLKKQGYKPGISPVVVYHWHPDSMKSLFRERLWYGRAKPPLIKKLGPWNAGLWAPLVMGYWLSFCIIKGKWNLLPYFMVFGIADNAGMVKGFFEMVTARKKSL